MDKSGQKLNSSGRLDQSRRAIVRAERTSSIVAMAGPATIGAEVIVAL
jgi:hypothetical protein